MGMELIPVKSDPLVKPVIYYSGSGWSDLWTFLEKHGVDTSEFSSHNDGNLISEKTCQEVAIVIEDNTKELEKLFGEKLVEGTINFWRHCGGCYPY
jgi:hypothetical protein